MEAGKEDKENPLRLHLHCRLTRKDGGNVYIYACILLVDSANRIVIEPSSTSMFPSCQHHREPKLISCTGR